MILFPYEISLLFFFFFLFINANDNSNVLSTKYMYMYLRLKYRFKTAALELQTKNGKWLKTCNEKKRGGTIHIVEILALKITCHCMFNHYTICYTYNFNRKICWVRSNRSWKKNYTLSSRSKICLEYIPHSYWLYF